MNSTSDLTQGRPFKLIMRFFFPLLLTNSLQQLYSFADTAIVGKGLGDDSLAAVGNMSSLCFLIIGFSMGLSNGFSILIAQSFGEKNMDKLPNAIVILTDGYAPDVDEKLALGVPVLWILINNEEQHLHLNL